MPCRRRLGTPRRWGPTTLTIPVLAMPFTLTTSLQGNALYPRSSDLKPSLRAVSVSASSGALVRLQRVRASGAPDDPAPAVRARRRHGPPLPQPPPGGCARAGRNRLVVLAAGPLPRGQRTIRSGLGVSRVSPNPTNPTNPTNLPKRKQNPKRKQDAATVSDTITSKCPLEYGLRDGERSHVFTSRWGLC